MNHGRKARKGASQAQRNRLAVLTGADPSQFTLAAPPAATLKLPSRTGFAQSADLLRRRSDVLAAEQHLIAATADIGSAIAVGLRWHLFDFGRIETQIQHTVCVRISCYSEVPCSVRDLAIHSLNQC